MQTHHGVAFNLSKILRGYFKKLLNKRKVFHNLMFILNFLKKYFCVKTYIFLTVWNIFFPYALNVLTKYNQNRFLIAAEYPAIINIYLSNNQLLDFWTTYFFQYHDQLFKIFFVSKHICIYDYLLMMNF